MYRYGTLVLMLVFVPGCFLIFPPDNGDLTGLSTLKRFQSEQELTDYFRDQIAGRNNQIDFVADFGRLDSEALLGDAPAAPLDGASSGGADAVDGGGDGVAVDGQGSFSETTIQEVGVDEADVVKTDGSLLYIIHDKTLRIVRVSPREQFGIVAEMELEGFGRELYLHDGKVIALTETFGGFFGFGGGISLVEPLILDDADSLSDELPPDDVASLSPPIDYQYERPRTTVTIFDVTSPDSPVLLTQTSFDGTQSSSRMIDGVLHMVVANFQRDFFDVVPMLGRPELDISRVDGSDLLPTYERIDAEGLVTSGPLVTWENMYRPTDPDGFGVVTVVSLDTGDLAAGFQTVGIVAEPGLIYSSTDALYLTDTNWDFFGNARETTDIYKLDYDGVGATPIATGTVRGRILNQYSMGEYSDFLRVATSVGPQFSVFGQVRESSNSVFVMEELEGKLIVAGRIENIAPGETIQSARFVGNRGYLVTFRQIDPLFTIDLVDPHDPRIVGELKIPGFSTFILPMGEDHLLTVGQYVPEDGFFFGRGVQLSIFDVSNFAEPVLQHLEVIGGESADAWSEALNNPKAFTYFADSGLLALPIETYDFGFPIFDDPIFIDGDGGVAIAITDTESEPVPVADEPPPDGDTVIDEPVFVPEEFRGLAVYRVSTDGGFESIGRINTEFDDGFYWTAFTRGVFIDGDVFAVTNRGVRGASVSDMASITHDLQFEQIGPDFVDDPFAVSGNSDAGGRRQPAP